MPKSGLDNKYEPTSRRAFAASLANSGVVISKTGGAYKNPLSIIRSSTAQAQLKAIAQIRKRVENQG